VTSGLSGKRVLLLGAETELGRATTAALTEAGARVAVVGATNDPETAFAVQRLARKVGADVSQAIDATNEMAVRVMVRQVSKALGGLEGVVCAVEDAQTAGLVRKQAAREFRRRGYAGSFVATMPEAAVEDVLAALAAPAS
jgi:NAD(P)-dependent dehydrogenase (short-subunit alcohol dehydrogenase family)